MANMDNGVYMDKKTYRESMKLLKNLQKDINRTIEIIEPSKMSK